MRHYLFLTIIILFSSVILFSCKKDDDTPDNNTMPPTPVNTNPIALFTVLPDSGEVYTPFSFDASLSADIEDAIDLLLVKWDFEGNGSWDTQWSFEKTSIHLYADTGNYYPMLKVRDSDGGEDSISMQVHVYNEEPPLVSKFEILTDYLIDNNMDFDHVINAWITDANTVYTSGPENYHIMDIRSYNDYASGHIEGSVHSSLSTIVADAAVTTKPILVTCYTGQTSAHAVIALRLSGFADAKVLKWGMAGWNSALSSPWTSNIGNAAHIYPSSWAAPPGNITSPLIYSGIPDIESTSSDGATILAERVSALTANGFNGVSNVDILSAPTNYFINNFWDEADVVEYGNIQPAYRLKPFTLAAATYKNLDPTKTIVTYDWTGQTSSMISAYLCVIGYDAKNLNFGVNGMIYDDLISHKYTMPGTDYPLVTSK